MLQGVPCAIGYGKSDGIHCCKAIVTVLNMVCQQYQGHIKLLVIDRQGAVNI